MADASLTRKEAIDRLAQRLIWKLEHIDPTEETWETLSEGDRDLWRHAIGDLLCAPREWFYAVWDR